MWQFMQLAALFSFKFHIVHFILTRYSRKQRSAIHVTKIIIHQLIQKVEFPRKTRALIPSMLLMNSRRVNLT